MSLSGEQVRRGLRHLAVLNRWNKYDFDSPAAAKKLYEEWAADFSMRLRAMTSAQLQRLLSEHRAALKEIAEHAYGPEIDAAKSFLAWVRDVAGKNRR